MSRLPRVLTVALLAALLHAAATPCPAFPAADATPGGAPVAEVARAGDHEGGPRLVAPCPCGCDEHAPTAPGLHGLDVALLPTPPAPNPGPATRPFQPFMVSAVSTPGHPIDHVPRAA